VRVLFEYSRGRFFPPLNFSLSQAPRRKSYDTDTHKLRQRYPMPRMRNRDTFANHAPRRVGVDKKSGEIVVLDQTQKGEFHGHVRSWQDLTQQARNALIKAKLTDKKGNIL